jgi:hypothetical protein
LLPQRNTGAYDALSRNARMIKRPGYYSSHDSEVPYETRFVNFVPERSRARGGLLPAACGRLRHGSSELGQLDAIEFNAEHVKHAVGYIDASGEHVGFEFDADTFKPELELNA